MLTVSTISFGSKAGKIGDTGARLGACFGEGSADPARTTWTAADSMPTQNWAKSCATVPLQRISV